jgi:hypothetical protein
MKLENLSLAQEQASTPLLFYPNHLGIRGLVMLLDKLRPKVAIISEFGEELKDVRFKLVQGISQLLEKRRAPKENAVFLVPGDLTVVYDIGECAFFCHDTKKFHKPLTLRVVESGEPEGSRYYSPGVNRTYLFAKKESLKDIRYIVDQYHLDVTHHGQPYCHCARRATQGDPGRETKANERGALNGEMRRCQVRLKDCFSPVRQWWPGATGRRQVLFPGRTRVRPTHFTFSEFPYGGALGDSVPKPLGFSTLCLRGDKFGPMA